MIMTDILISTLVSPLTKTVLKSATSILHRRKGTSISIKGGTISGISGVSEADVQKVLETLQLGSGKPQTRSEAITPTRPKQAQRRSGGSSAKRTRQVNPGNVVVGDEQQVVVSPVFKLVFLTIVSLTVLSGVGATAMSFAADGIHPNQQAVFDSMNTAWKLGLGAILGLLGGKAT